MTLNSFQQWATDYARGFGFTVTPCGNWVKLTRGTICAEFYTVQGVKTICEGVRHA